MRHNGFTMSKKVVLKLVWCYFFVFLLLPGPSFECGPGRGVGRRRRPRKMTPLVFKQHVPNVSENTLGASGIAESRIKRVDKKFAELKTNHNPDIIFKNEEGTNADRKMTQRCKDKLNTLAISVMNQWSGIKLRVTEAWDEDSRHAENSLHYEGRAVDITTSDRDRSKYGMLARLAVEAGFDWVYYESRGHVHCSVKSDSSIAVKTGGCFPEEARVQVPGGHTIAMSELEVGQEVLAVSGTGQLEYSEVLMFLDREGERRMQFIQLETATNNRLTLTPSHLIYATDDVTEEADVSLADISPIFASKVRTGQYIYVANKNTVELDRVVKVISRTDLGVYAPLTKHGTIVVNDVIASCYAVIESQDIAHASFIPLRLYNYVTSIFRTTTNSTLADKSPIQGQNGVHWYAELLHSLAWHILPRRLWFDL